MTRSKARRADGLILATAAAAAAFSCAAGPRPTPPDRPAPPAPPLAFLREVRVLSQSLDFGAALDVLKHALDDAQSGKDAAVGAAVLQARAWVLLNAGDLPGAKEALAQSVALDSALKPGERLLEYRILAAEDKARADSYAASTMSDPGTPPEAAAVLAVMTGSSDIRDLDLSTEGGLGEYAMYLEGYRVDGYGERLTPGQGGPSVVVRNPESVGADPGSIALVKLAMRDALIASGAFGVYDAESRMAALDELELSLSAGAAERDAAVGRVFQADYVASGSVVRTDTGWFVALTCSQASDGRIVASEFSPAPDHSAMAEAAKRFAGYLAQKARSGSL